MSDNLDARSATEKKTTFLTFIDNSNITRLKQFHEKSINNKIDGRELVLGHWTCIWSYITDLTLFF